MSDALNIALGGLNKTLSSVVRNTARVVNASSTINSFADNLQDSTAKPESGNNSSSNTDGDSELTAGLVGLQLDTVAYNANAKVVSVVSRLNKTLIDTIA